MQTAKLFAILAGVLISFATLVRVRVIRPMNLYLPVKDILFDSYGWLLLGGLACACFSLFYFVMYRWGHQALSPVKGLVSFGLISGAFFVWMTFGSLIRRDSGPANWLIIILQVARASFVVGSALAIWELALFSVNLVRFNLSKP